MGAIPEPEVIDDGRQFGDFAVQLAGADEVAFIGKLGLLQVDRFFKLGDPVGNAAANFFPVEENCVPCIKVILFPVSFYVWQGYAQSAVIKKKLFHF